MVLRVFMPCTRFVCSSLHGTFFQRQSLGDGELIGKLKLLFVGLFMIPASVAAVEPKSDNDSKSWYSSAIERVRHTWKNGRTEILLPLNIHHLRSAYSREKISTFQEYPAGIGIEHGLYNSNGNYEGVYAFLFEESHYKPQYNFGYEWRAIWGSQDGARFGLGYATGVLGRPEPGNYFPLPFIIPVMELGYNRLSVQTLFIPGNPGNGNVFFTWLRYSID